MGAWPGAGDNWIAQGARFAAVGIAATATHVIVAGLAATAAGLAPQVANFAGWIVAVLVSVQGQAHFTFRSRDRADRARFAVVSVAAYLVSAVITWAMCTVAGYGVPAAMLVVVAIVPPTTFLLGRVWAFRSRSGSVFEG